MRALVTMKSILREDSEEFAFDMESRESPIREGLEPMLGTFKEVVFDDGLDQRGSGRVIWDCKVR